MSVKVDHEARKREIARKATHLFSQVGYDNVSLIMIAQACGIARTALYRYFCSKLEVLDASILAITDEMGAKSTMILRGRESTVRKLERIGHMVIDALFDNKDFVIAIFDHVVGMARTGAEMGSRIRAFTDGTRGAMRLLLEHGKRRGELAAILDVDRTTDALYTQFESCALRIVLGTERDATAARMRFSDAILALSIERKPSGTTRCRRQAVVR